MFGCLRTDYWQKLSPEWKLLCIASRFRLNSGEKQALSQLCGNKIDWGLFLKLVNYHGVCNLVSLNLLTEGQSLLPGNIRDELKQNRTRIAKRNLYLQKQLLDIFEIFESNSIPAIPIKGITLSQKIYGDLTVRHSRDLDILIKQDDLFRCDELLLSENYNRVEPALDIRKIPENYVFRMLHSFTYIMPDRNGYVDIHWCLTQFPYLSGDLYFDAGKTGTVKISNKDLNLASLQDILLYLIIHGANSPRQRLIWLNDIANIFRLHHDKVNFSEVYKQAKKLGFERSVAQAMYMVNTLFATPIPDEINPHGTKTELSLDLMIRITYAKLLTSPNGKSNTLASIKRLFLIYCHRFLLVPGVGYKLTCIIKLFQPGMLDFPHWLPDRLYYLAYFFRPFGVIKRLFK